LLLVLAVNERRYIPVISFLLLIAVSYEWSLKTIIDRGLNLDNRSHYIACWGVFVENFNFHDRVPNITQACFNEAKNATEHRLAYNRPLYDGPPVFENSALKLASKSIIHLGVIVCLLLTLCYSLMKQSFLLLIPFSLLLVKLFSADLIDGSVRDIPFMTMLFVSLFHLKKTAF
jgi:hypothetical protein